MLASYKTMIDSEDWLTLLRAVRMDLADQKVTVDEVSRAISTLFKPTALSKVNRYKGTRVSLSAEEIYKITDRKTSFRLPKNVDVELIDNNPQLSINWELYRRLLAHYRQGDLIRKYNIMDRVYSFELLKELSTYAFKCGPKCSGYRYLVGIHLLYGYNYEATLVSQTSYIKDWLVNNFKPNFLGSEEDYYTVFREEVAGFLAEQTIVSEIPYTIDQFCLDVTLTGTSGSGYDPGGDQLKFEIDDKIYRVYNNKYAKSCKLSPDNKKLRLLNTKTQRARASVKVELGDKVRLILSSDFNTFLKMQFVDTWLDKVLHGCPESTLWQTKRQTTDMWTQFSDIGSFWNLPIDQTNFDFHITKLDNIIITEEISKLAKRTIVDKLNREHMVTVIDNLAMSMDNMTVSYTDPEGIEQRIDYKSGLPSGWKWTAKYGTICNIIQKRMANRIAKMQIPQYTEQVLFNAQGDDQLNRFRNQFSAIVYWLSLSSMGYLVNPKKNYLSKTHDEYLRTTVDLDGVNGYPARMVNKICWMYPGKSDALSEIEKLNTIYDRWFKIGQRMGDVHNPIIPSMMVKDVEGAKLSIHKSMAYFGASKYNGGVGSTIFPRNNLTINVMPGRFLKRVEPVDAKGLQKFKEVFGKYQESEIDNWVLSATAFPNTIKGVEVKTQPEVQLEDTRFVKPLPFVIADVSSLRRPTMIEGWSKSAIFGTSRELLQHVFPTINTFIDHGNAPKSWVFDYILGRLKIPLPEMDGYSPAAISMISERYVNSLYLAMYKKKRTSDKWLRLCKFYMDNLPDLVISAYKNVSVVL